MVVVRFILVNCLVLLSILSVFSQTIGHVPAPFHSAFERQVFSAYRPGFATDPVALLLMADSSVAGEAYAQGKTRLAGYLEVLKAKQTSYVSAKQFLRWSFRHTHQQFLRRFVAYQPFSQLLEKGVYNCVSATDLFALLLEELGYPYQIYETPFHLYLLVKYKPGKRLLLESTDPDWGIVTGKQTIAHRQTRYTQPDSTSWCAKAALCTLAQNATCPTYYVRAITLTELCGLQYKPSH